jgi:CSLREA domain-containing protein
LVLVRSAGATAINVTSAADAGGICPGATCTLRQAIATAASGDSINFATGITTINLTSAELLITKNLTIRGAGAKLLSVQRTARSC